MQLKPLSIGLLLACLAAPAFAQPRVDALQNNYSFLIPGDPNYGIARGSIFVMYGQNLANTSTGLQSATTPPSCRRRSKASRRRSASTVSRRT